MRKKLIFKIVFAFIISICLISLYQRNNSSKIENNVNLSLSSIEVYASNENGLPCTATGPKINGGCACRNNVPCCCD